MPPVANLSREERVLFLAAGTSQQDAEIGTLLSEPIDHRLLYMLAARERAVPIVWQRFQRLALTELPSDVADSYRRYSAVSSFRLMHLDQRLNEAADALAAAGIPMLLLKGAALGRTVYGTFVRRPMIDLDLLVKSVDLERAVAVLREIRWAENEIDAGKHFYEAHHHQAPLEDQTGTGFTLELHTEAVGGAERFGLSSAAIWGGARETTVDGRLFRVPSTPHQMVHLSVHFVWSHTLSSAGWRTFRDICTICDVEAVDWDAVVELATRGGAASCCYWTFRLAKELSHAAVPPEVLRALRPKVPEFMLAGLQRHYVNELAHPNTGCPSIQLRRALWELGVRPRRHGHGASRPWDRTRAYLREYGSSQKDRNKMPPALQLLGAWGRYFRGVSGVSKPAAGGIS